MIIRSMDLVGIYRIEVMENWDRRLDGLHTSSQRLRIVSDGHEVKLCIMYSRRYPP